MSESNRSRRAKGEGGLSLRADGLYQATLSLKDPETGKRIRRVFYGRTQREALDKLKIAQRDADAGVMKPSADTVSVLFDKWLESISRDVRVTTLDSYTKIYEWYIKPKIGNVPLTKVTPMVVDGMLNSLRKEGKSDSVLRKAYDKLNLALKQAVQWKLLAHNPMAGVKRPRYRPKQFGVWSPEQVTKFLEFTKDHWLHALFVTALNTGMRQGELLGLQWADVDLHTGTIHVHQQLLEIDNKLLGLGPLKSESGNRVLTIGASVVSALRHQKLKLLGAGMGQSTYVFPNRSGEPYTKGPVNEQFQSLIAECGLPKIRFHDQRHTNATILVANGTDFKTLQGRFGHADISITLGTYAKFTKAGDEKAANLLENLLNRG